MIKEQVIDTKEFCEEIRGCEMDNETESGHGSSDKKTKKPKTDKFSNRTKRLRNAQTGHLGHRSSLDWRLDYEYITDPDADHGEFFSIDELKKIIALSRTGKTLLKARQLKKLVICYDDQVQFSQYYPSQQIITLNPHRPKGDLLNLLSRELRRCWQHVNGNLLNPLNFDPDEAILLNRAQLADALMFSIRIAWELKLGDEQDAWNYLAGAPNADVTRTFEVHAKSDFRSLNNGAAARAAYDKWFEENRTKIFDKRIIHQMLLDEHGYIEGTEKRTEHILCDDMLKRLGAMPHGENYLALSGYRQPMDPDYAMVEDRSNANFLWFIKFERDFQEKEKIMMEESITSSAEIINFMQKVNELGKH